MERKIIIDAVEMKNIQENLVNQILERVTSMDTFLPVGIQRRGVDLARRISKDMGERLGREIKYGALDINLYRDDWTCRNGRTPQIGVSSMPFSIDDKHILLIDDVLFSGRTVRSALEALLDYGRPRKVELLAYIDRGHRELPICADYIGKKITTELKDRIDVFFEERDGEDMVCLI